MAQCIDIKDLRVITQRLVQEGVDEEYISYIPDFRKMELYPKYLQHEERINNNNLSEKAINSLKVIRNSPPMKFQISNVFKCAKI
jgi:hypothetical protein